VSIITRIICSPNYCDPAGVEVLCPCHPGCRYAQPPANGLNPVGVPDVSGNIFLLPNILMYMNIGHKQFAQRDSIIIIDKKE